MSIINSQPLIGASGNQVTGYNLTKSLRTRASASASLTRTMTTPTNNLKWTLSAWVKRGSVLTTENQIINAGTVATDDQLVFTGSSQLAFYVANGASYYLVTNAVYRDPAAWYHIVFVYDSANATASNRLLMYVNGTQVTSFATAIYPTQNYASQINSAVLNRIGLRSNSASPFDGYMTEVNFVDGQALTPSSFGETDTITGVWKPKRYTGTYGTNGFYLPFTDVATTSGSNAGLGKDFSGNGNYWTTNNISVTTGTTYDSMTDVPTLTSATAANYCVLNPLDKGTNATIDNGNLRVYSSSGWTSNRGTMTFPSTGKYYFEWIYTSNSPAAMVGIATYQASKNAQLGSDVYGWGYHYSGDKYNNNTATAYGASYTTGDVIGVALDMDAGTLTFYKNNTSQGTAFSGLTGVYFPVSAVAGASAAEAPTINFGQRGFLYTPPTGFVALNTYNLPDSTIVAGNKVMDATTFTANGGTQTVVNAGGFKPDLIWNKARSTTSNHWLANSIVGPSYYLRSNLTDAEVNDATLYTSFNSNGYTLGSGNMANGTTMVGWQWQAGQGTTSSNTSGSITSTVSVNASAGFSIVTYTGTGANATVGHGLGVAPSMYITKQRSATGNWFTYHKSVGATAGLFLDTTEAATTNIYFNNTAPTSSVFSLGVAGGLNANGVTAVAYCWAEIAGFSKFGSYTGNGSTDGTFVYTGFRPKWVLIKKSSASGTDWLLYDTSRNPSNVTDLFLVPDANYAEQNDSSVNIDVLSNGIKLRGTNTTTNGSGATYIYIAFAENPFKNSLAR